jgi:hypothetical protein
VLLRAQKRNHSEVRVDDLTRRTHWYDGVSCRAERGDKHRIALRAARGKGVEEGVYAGTTRECAQWLVQVNELVAASGKEVGASGLVTPAAEGERRPVVSSAKLAGVVCARVARASRRP